MDPYRSSSQQDDQDGIGVIPVSLGRSYHHNPPPPPPPNINPIRVSAFSKPCSSSSLNVILSPKDHHHHHHHHHHGSSSAARNNNGSSSTTTEFISPTATTTADHPIQDHSNPLPVSISPSSANPKAAAAAVKYRECLRNHAASTGGHVLDGCCEFMSGSPDPLKCAACDCHRSFHRKQLSEGTSYYYSSRRDRVSVPLLLPPPHPPHHSYQKQQQQQQQSASFPPSPSGVVPGSSPMVAFGGNNSGGSGATTESSSEEMLDAGACAATPLHAQQINMAVSKKRFRTKFTPEQKEKMLSFAERAGWRIQRQDDATIENLCREIGVRRQVLKVWMHNNKHSIRKQQQEAQLQQQQQQHIIHQQQQQQQQPQQGATADSASTPTSQPPPPAIFGHVRN